MDFLALLDGTNNEASKANQGEMFGFIHESHDSASFHSCFCVAIANEDAMIGSKCLEYPICHAIDLGAHDIVQTL